MASCRRCDHTRPGMRLPSDTQRAREFPAFSRSIWRSEPGSSIGEGSSSADRSTRRRGLCSQPDRTAPDGLRSRPCSRGRDRDRPGAFPGDRPRPASSPPGSPRVVGARFERVANLAAGSPHPNRGRIRSMSGLRRTARSNAERSARVGASRGGDAPLTSCGTARDTTGRSARQQAGPSPPAPPPITLGQRAPRPFDRV